jgi:hypothetical protein
MDLNPISYYNPIFAPLTKILHPLMPLVLVIRDNISRQAKFLNNHVSREKIDKSVRIKKIEHSAQKKFYILPYNFYFSINKESAPTSADTHLDATLLMSMS